PTGRHFYRRGSVCGEPPRRLRYWVVLEPVVLVPVVLGILVPDVLDAGICACCSRFMSSAVLNDGALLIWSFDMLTTTFSPSSSSLMSCQFTATCLSPIPRNPP